MLTKLNTVKFFKNVTLPYEARIKPTIDELNKFIRRVKERVDVHNTHRLAVMQYDISALIDMLDDSRRLQVNSHAVIAQLLQGIASDQTKGIDLPVESTTSSTYTMLKGKLPSEDPVPREGSSDSSQTLPNLQLPFERLKDCAIQSVQLEAKHSYLALDLPNRPEVKAWLGSKHSALLWIDGYANPRTSKWTTEFAVDVLLGVERQSSTVLFYFCDVAMNDIADPSSSYLASPRALIHSFIVQLLHQQKNLARTEADWLTPERWTETRCSTKAAWTLLHYLLQSSSAEASTVYLIIDSIDALSVNAHPCYLQPFLRRLSALVTSSPCWESAGSLRSLAVKILLTSVTGSTPSLLFPPGAAGSLPSHSIVHIPQTFGQHNVATPPDHLRKPSVKRLVRLPDSDDEYGLKPADNFGFSDEEGEEDLTFSSEEEMKESQPMNGKRGKKVGREVLVQTRKGQYSSHKVNRTPVRSESGSSEELDFSENETDTVHKGKRDTDDLQFSSSEDELLES